jgi:hypothetical protein
MAANHSPQPGPPQSPSSDILVSNVPIPRKEQADINYPGFTRGSAGQLTREHRGYIIHIIIVPMGFVWVVNGPIPGSDKGHMGMKFASPSFREVWRSNQHYASEREAADAVIAHEDHIIDRLEQDKQKP